MLGSLRRGRGRGAGGVAAPEPRRHQRRREPRRLADHGGGARLPRHAAGAQVAARGAARHARARSDRHQRRDPARARRCSPTRSAWRCWSCSRRSTPAERLAFVLHDMFAVPSRRSRPIVGRSPTAARQLASRARRRVQRRGRTPEPDSPAQRAVVDAFLAASRGGDFDALVAGARSRRRVARRSAAPSPAGASREIARRRERRQAGPVLPPDRRRAIAWSVTRSSTAAPASSTISVGSPTL